MNRAAEFALLARARDAEASRLLRYRGVNGVGVGYRWRDGQLTDEPCLGVLVTKKRPRGYLPKSQVLPNEITHEGHICPIDVIQAGPFYGDSTLVVEADPPVFAGEVARPLRGGCEIEPLGAGSFGTLGCIVRDQVDDSLAMLSNRHVLVTENTEPGDRIVQPGRGEEVAAFTRDVPYPSGVEYIRSDVAIATLLPGVEHDERFMPSTGPGLMPPVSEGHKAVGLHFAGDGLGLTGLFCQIESVLTDINAELLSGGGSTEYLTAFHTGRAIEKVGRTTGYTSSRILLTGVESPVWVDGRPVLFADCVMTFRFALPGDSGSLVCLGGDGSTWTPIPWGELPCVTTESVGRMYDLPLVEDQALADRIRDEFLASSVTGGLLIQCFYTNQDAIYQRTAGQTTSDTEKEFADAFYAKYRDFIESALDNPDDPAYAVTEDHIGDLQLMYTGIEPRLTHEESVAFYRFIDEVVTPAVGLSFRQLVERMNDPEVFALALDILGDVPTIEIPGPFEAYGADSHVGP